MEVLVKNNLFLTIIFSYATLMFVHVYSMDKPKNTMDAMVDLLSTEEKVLLEEELRCLQMKLEDERKMLYSMKEALDTTPSAETIDESNPKPIEHGINVMSEMLHEYSEAHNTLVSIYNSLSATAMPFFEPFSNNESSKSIYPEKE